MRKYGWHHHLSLIFISLIVMGNGWTADYDVAPAASGGSDANSGTKARPFDTLAKASAAARPGDTVYLRGGTYRETLTPGKSGEPGKPIRFVATPGEKVVLSGAEPLTGTWERYRGKIYKLATPLKFIQLFVDGRMMLEARWPNSSPTDLMAVKRATAGEGTDYDTLVDPHLPPGDWNGAIVRIWPGSRWVNATRRIVDYQPGKSLRFDHDMRPQHPDKFHATDPYRPRAGNPYLLVGSLAGLDSPGEWFLDEKTGTVYLWTMAGNSPQQHVVEVKQRDYACDFSKLGFIELQGVDIFGAAVNMTDSHDCLLENCRLRYVEHIRESDLNHLPPPENVVTGRNNEWRHCLIAYGATTALRLAGEDNRLVDCVIHDANYFGTGRGGLDLSNSIGAQVLHCSIFRTGRDIIQHGRSQRIRLEYNDLYNANMLNNDAGAIYCWGTDGKGGVIAYNWVHDNLGDSTVGIYLDNFSSNFIVHHNVVWNCTGSGIRLNCDALNHLVCNNTITAVREPFGTYTYAKHTPTMKGTRIINNLVNAAINPKDPSQLVQGELGPEFHNNGPGAVDRDAMPVTGSAAIDAGVVIPGITDGFNGKAPDLGAYEFGGKHWVAGADWHDPDAPPPPAKDLSFAPRPPLTESTMIRDGLVLWLDAADAGTFNLGLGGTVLAWHDKSLSKRVARPVDPAKPVLRVPDALNGRPVVRGDGTGSLRVNLSGGEPGPVTVLVVSQASAAAGPSWQRIIACFTGSGQEWVLPNWMVLRPGADKPQAYPSRIFSVQARTGAALATLTVLGASANNGQCLAGDVAEVLVFNRNLRFDDFAALEQYLRTKWKIQN